MQPSLHSAVSVGAGVGAKASTLDQVSAACFVPVPTSPRGLLLLGTTAGQIVCASSSEANAGGSRSLKSSAEGAAGGAQLAASLNVNGRAGDAAGRDGGLEQLGFARHPDRTT